MAYVFACVHIFIFNPYYYYTGMLLSLKTIPYFYFIFPLLFRPRPSPARRKRWDNVVYTHSHDLSTCTRSLSAITVSLTFTIQLLHS